MAEARPNRNGQRCIDKVVFLAVLHCERLSNSKFISQVEMVEETEYDDVVQCDHSYDRR